MVRERRKGVCVAAVDKQLQVVADVEPPRDRQNAGRFRGKDERAGRVLINHCTSSLLALVQDAAEEPSTYCFADTLETKKRDALSARRGSCQKPENPIPTPCAVFRDRDPS